MKDKVPPVAKILKAQGHLVVRCREPLPVGKVYDGVNGGSGFIPIGVPVVVTAHATRKEWEDQYYKFSGLADQPYEMQNAHFAKVVPVK